MVQNPRHRAERGRRGEGRIAAAMPGEGEGFERGWPTSLNEAKEGEGNKRKGRRRF